LFEKTVSNMQEVRARGGRSFLISGAAGLEEAEMAAWQPSEMPKVRPLIPPIVCTLSPLTACYMWQLPGHRCGSASKSGKSVTVE
jgi:glucosamine--fructose-6-phosphate aminotransferase (isomerizing)